MRTQVIEVDGGAFQVFVSINDHDAVVISTRPGGATLAPKPALELNSEEAHALSRWLMEMAQYLDHGAHPDDVNPKW